MHGPRLHAQSESDHCVMQSCGSGRTQQSYSIALTLDKLQWDVQIQVLGDHMDSGRR